MADIKIVLVEPEIPQNTGNIARTCACIGAELHLVEPMGFRLSERQLKRAGLDYWNEVNIVRHASLAAFFENTAGSQYRFFTGQAHQSYDELSYEKGVYLLFGKESGGIDSEVLAAHQKSCARIPMREGLRSLNLSNAVAVASYEVLRTWNFPGLV